ncbi:MAG: DUF5688 family protein [bacterium]|nr:DUF5688 family protein [bacterium]
MQYQTFLTQLQFQLADCFKKHAKISFFSVPKNNGTSLDAFCITPEGKSISPTLYVQDYYRKYQSGESMQHILDEIYALFVDYQSLELPPFHQYGDFSYAKSHIAYKLVHTEMNRKLLSQIPHLPFLDLSIVFFLHLERKGQLPMTSLIYHRHLEAWNCSLEELWKLASENTPRLFPPTIGRLDAILNELLKSQSPSFSLLLPMRTPIYILSNCLSLYGACCILYPNILHTFANSLNRNLILIPSSIHEFLLLPEEEALPLSELNDMVNSVNHSSVLLEERLSDHVYYYSKEKRQLTIPSLSDSAFSP